MQIKWSSPVTSLEKLFEEICKLMTEFELTKWSLGKKAFIVYTTRDGILILTVYTQISLALLVHSLKIRLYVISDYLLANMFHLYKPHTWYELKYYFKYL